MCLFHCVVCRSISEPAIKPETYSHETYKSHTWTFHPKITQEHVPKQQNYVCMEPHGTATARREYRLDNQTNSPQCSRVSRACAQSPLQPNFTSWRQIKLREDRIYIIFADTILAVTTRIILIPELKTLPISTCIARQNMYSAQQSWRRNAMYIVGFQQADCFLLVAWKPCHIRCESEAIIEIKPLKHANL